MFQKARNALTTSPGPKSRSGRSSFHTVAMRKPSATSDTGTERKTSDQAFLPYLEALRSHDLEPRYAFHQEKQEAQQGFTDLVVSTGKKAFYRILDALYAVCGLENFNAEAQYDQLVASIRNGQYALNEFVAKDVLRIMRTYIQSGKVMSKGNHWIFSRSDRTVQLIFEEEIYEGLEKLAEAEDLSLQGWLKKVLDEKRNS